MSRFLSFAAVSLIASSAPAYAGEEVLFGPPPEWVVPPSVPANISDAQAADLPVFYHVTDYQTRLEPGQTSIYTALSLEFRTPQGLSAGNLSLGWQPEFDELTVHYVRIRRPGEVIDVLDEGQTFTVLRREQSLEEATLTGALTANMFPAGLEVGDTLEVAFTLTQANPVLAGYPGIALGPFNGAVGYTNVRISWPESLPVALSTTRGLPTIERGRRRGYEFAGFELVENEPIVPPAGAPTRYQLTRMIEASAFPDWAELAQHFVPLYERASQIPADGRLRTELETIRAASADPAVRAEMALALVQDKVRYVALAMGVGGLLPADAGATWSRRYGDCKAKTALLLGLLHELGIEAEPLLVHSVLGDALPGRLPLVEAFDHVLVRAHIGGRDYFLDGTGTGDTSLTRLATPNFSWGLPVLAEGAELVRMVPEALTIPDEDQTIRIDASAGLRAPAPVQAEVLLRGGGAVASNIGLTNLVGAERRQAMESYWRERFDSIEIANVAMQFDPASGELKLTMSGTAELDWDHNTFEPRGMRVGYTPDFTRAPGADADAPFVVPHAFYDRATQIITLPSGFSAAQIDGEAVAPVVVAGLEYHRELSLENNVFTGVRTTRSIAPEFAASDANEAKRTLEGLWAKRVFIDIPPNYQLTQSEISTMSRADSADVQALINQGVALMDAGEWAGARGVFDRVLELSPDNEWGWANRAAVLAQMGLRSEAEVDIARTLSINPENQVAYHARGLLAKAANDGPATIAAFTRAIELEANNIYALRQRADAYAKMRDFPAALADARRLTELQPDFPINYIAQGMILAEMGRREEVVAHVEAMLARFPNENGVRAAASDMFMTIGMEAEADAMLAQSLDGDPNVMALLTSASRRDIDETAEKLSELNRAVALAPDFVPALLMRGQTLWMEYQLTRALADANHAIEVAPDAVEAYDLKIKVLLDLKRTAEAIQATDALVAAGPSNTFGLVQAALHYRELGRTTKARETIQRARELAPDDDGVRQASDYINGRMPATRR